MSKLLLRGALLASLVLTPLFALNANAIGFTSIYNAVTTSDWETKATTKYKIDTKGFDLRAYRWEDEKLGSCLLVFGKNSATKGQTSALKPVCTGGK